MPYRERSKRIAYLKGYRRANRKVLLKKKVSYWKRQRLEVLLHYSNDSLCCACCGESTYEFLALDHIDGGGNAHRKRLGSKYILSYLKQSGFPSGYQVLCHNCNLAKGFYGKCPHSRNREERKLAEELHEECKNELLRLQFEQSGEATAS